MSPPQDATPTDLDQLRENLDRDRRMRSVLIAMQCLSYGTTTAWNPSHGGRQKPTGGNRPPGEASPLHTTWQAAYVLADGADAREQVIVDATDALIEARVRTTPVPQGETPEQWRARIIKDGEGFDADHVALAFNCIPRMVRKIRLAAKREPDYGRIVVPAEPGERRELVRQLVNVEGMSMRAASMRLGVNYSTVLRDLGKKAA